MAALAEVDLSADLLELVGGIGKHVELRDDSGHTVQKYQKGDFWIESLQDLQRSLRADDEQRSAQRLLGRWDVVASDLIPLWMSYPNDEKVVTNIVRLLVMLTVPIHGFDLAAVAVERSSELIASQRRVKRLFCSDRLLPLFVRFFLEPATVPAYTRNMDQLRSIDLSLHLIRNLAYVGDDDERGSGIGHRLHEDFLVALAQHDALETLVLLEQQSINQRKYAPWAFLLSEIFALLFRNLDPIASASRVAATHIGPNNLSPDKNTVKTDANSFANDAVNAGGDEQLDTDDDSDSYDLDKILEKSRKRERLPVEPSLAANSVSKSAPYRHPRLPVSQQGWHAVRSQNLVAAKQRRSQVSEAPRHGKWGGSFAVKFAGGERENVPRPISRQLNAPAKPMPTPAAIRGTRRAAAATNVLPLAMHARSIPVCKVPNIVLRTVDQFLDVIFNSFVTYAKENLLSGETGATSARMFENDRNNWLWLSSFFLQYHIEKEQQRIALLEVEQQRDEQAVFDVSRVSECIDLELFALLTEQLSTFISSPSAQRKQRTMELCVRLLKALMLTLDMMEQYGDERVKESSMVIQSNLFYDVGRYHCNRVIDLIRVYQPSFEAPGGSSAGLVLTDALAIVHLTFNMMERLTDNRMAFRMRGKDKIEVLIPRDFYVHAAHQNVISNLCEVLAGYKENSAFTNHHIVKLFHRIAIDCGAEVMFFQASLLALFHNILVDPSDDATLKELKKFAAMITRRFFRALKENRTMVVEALFWKTFATARQLSLGTAGEEKKKATKKRKKPKRTEPELEEVDDDTEDIGDDLEQRAYNRFNRSLRMFSSVSQLSTSRKGDVVHWLIATFDEARSKVALREHLLEYDPPTIEAVLEDSKAMLSEDGVAAVLKGAGFARNVRTSVWELLPTITSEDLKTRVLQLRKFMADGFRIEDEAEKDKQTALELNREPTLPEADHAADDALAVEQRDSDGNVDESDDDSSDVIGGFVGDSITAPDLNSGWMSVLRERVLAEDVDGDSVLSWLSRTLRVTASEVALEPDKVPQIAIPFASETVARHAVEDVLAHVGFEKREQEEAEDDVLAGSKGTREAWVLERQVSAIAIRKIGREIDTMWNEISEQLEALRDEREDKMEEGEQMEEVEGSVLVPSKRPREDDGDDDSTRNKRLRVQHAALEMDMDVEVSDEEELGAVINEPANDGEELHVRRDTASRKRKVILEDDD